MSAPAHPASSGENTKEHKRGQPRSARPPHGLHTQGPLPNIDSGGYIHTNQLLPLVSYTPTCLPSAPHQKCCYTKNLFILSTSIPHSLFISHKSTRN